MQAEIQLKFNEVDYALDILKKHVDWNNSISKLRELSSLIENPNFWNDSSKAQIIMRDKTNLEKIIETIKNIENEKLDLIDILYLAEQENDNDLIEDTNLQIEDLVKRCLKLQLESLLSGEADSNNCYIEIHAGAGGTEAQDWALMLQRMYSRWSEKRGYKVSFVEESSGDEAGIKSCTMFIEGLNAYGWSKTESGVHRLVRISPFDSSARRHTSFASIWVYPQINDEIDIEVEEKDLRIDTYRASGAGGQHVNKTDSAIRITHMPTNTVVQCQNDRSQHRNRAQAMSMLKAKLYEIELKRREEVNNQNALSKGEIGWGSQIRSYVLHPYQMVKDLRTNIEVGNTQSVLDGELDIFIESALALKVGMKR
ncbi:peptide chain release factor 2 [Alphaproteobacteria bacterium]|jgi:peptide chain release factor 2|nr:peptide chain release factor 2 [Alphaproteobacteria bacterium]|tara:strand:+ start:4486 stop:5592 length:1107 start_codon:yes stop_codon:yes gene_type:complete